MTDFQSTTQNAPSPMVEEDKDADARAPQDKHNLEDAFIIIDGKRYKVSDLLKLVVDQLMPSKD
jgi:hypothetical protein